MSSIRSLEPFSNAVAGVKRPNRTREPSTANTLSAGHRPRGPESTILSEPSAQVDSGSFLPEQKDILLLAALVEQVGGDSEAFLAHAASTAQFNERIVSGNTDISLNYSATQELHAATLTTDGARIQYASYRSNQRVEFSFEVADERGERMRVEGFVEIEVQAEVFAAASVANVADPLALDLNRDGRISLSGVDDGESFDLNADGFLDRTQFVRNGDVFLALDRNRNGMIDDGKELFGDQNGASNGFLELMKFDENGDFQIDRFDPIFRDLLGLSSNNGTPTLRSLGELGVESLSLEYLQNQGPVAQIGKYRATDGTEHLAADLLLQYA